MTLPYLTDDCIHYILQFLQNDFSTLRKCLLVNRFWCKSTIPLLYANPFAKTKSPHKNYKLIITLVSCFDKAEILQFKERLSKFVIIYIDDIKEDYKPLFEYPKYLKDYNYFKINYSINSFVRYCSDSLISNSKIYEAVIPIFHRSLLRQSRNIKHLDIFLHLFNNESFENFNVQNFITNLTKLKSLSFCLDINNKKFEQEFLINIPNNLKQLIINLPRNSTRTYQRSTPNNLVNTTTWERLCKTIQEQNKLEIFKINSFYTLSNNVLLSLEFQKHSLVHIEFINASFINVDLKDFNNLYNLEYLKFEFCTGILSNKFEILKFASFKLKELSIIRNKWNADATPSMIEFFGESLQRLFVEPPTIHLIENISMYCPNLIYLKLRIYSRNNLSILASFKNLKTKMLSITTCHDIDKFFINLANNIPINVSKISIHTRPLNKFLKFKEFLENCHNSFEMINLNHIIKLKYLKIVLNYIERSNNSLKILGMKKLEKELNDEELNLLNQIKAKGVKIVEFNSIHKGEYDIL
ncbi:uncharacterized protein OCT59_017679 [Rhizophagus irregularis]|uniref:F-box domain-containing protein n=1 Tax=Rhizophagus irregularis (strain DAOM 197198w) TaxID=1432141 RepID=A0A015JXF7_RHIIW|nr:hypothetical protein RirG_073070 [Rhizophagus irregularis DAOM 197198w]UZO25414.1 hypothetical protein OCT59_017679 [Rhizophagus irregularis]CAG8663188.1 3195_t:CDS:1 [Rhizophagus irregularis]